MKTKLAIISVISLISLPSFAFYSVTEVLPSGKILICKESGQVKKGDVVEVFKRADSKSSSDYSTVKSHEFKLPSIGQKVTLTHKDFHPLGRKSAYHTEELGSAIISGDTLEGEERIVHSLDNTRQSKRITTTTKISKEEAHELQKNCLVAIPENGLKIKERAAVSWQ